MIFAEETRNESETRENECDQNKGELADLGNGKFRKIIDHQHTFDF